MDAEFEDGTAEIEVLEGELVRGPRAGAVDRVRAVVASPPVQAATAATVGFVAGAAALALMRRSALARAGRQLQSVGPRQASWPAGPTVGPIRPGTYLVTVRAIAPRPPQ